MPRTPLLGGRRLAGFVLLLLALAVAGVVAHRHALQAGLEETARRGDVTLRLAVESLQSRLERFERLPKLLAEHEVITRLAGSPADPALVALANGYLKRIGSMIGASDVYFMDRSGLTRAASNFDTPTSFIGGNFAFRPYFLDALRGGEGRFYALGTTSRKRGYYFGAPVRGAAGVVGVIVIKVDLDEIEESWRGGGDAILVTSPEGVVFLSSRPGWLFRLIEPLTPERSARMQETRRFADARITPLELTRSEAANGLLTLEIAEDGGRARYLKRAEPMAAADWEVWVLVDTAAARREALVVAALVVLAACLGVLGLWQISARRARLRERLEMKDQAQAELEARVLARTAELAAARDRLEQEVAERRGAEAQLRKAQTDLVQAGKMAALGQMSAALSHEFNQPLAAARNYAENALTLMDRGRPEDARGNLQRILDLVDRMAAIARHLRSFARMPGQKLGPVQLSRVLDEALEIAGLRLREAGAELIVDLPPDLPPVEGGAVRLQQVLVNLLTNAADAAEMSPDRRIHLEAEACEQVLRVTLRDHGPGFAPGIVERIFDPFFSTKGVGKGLGLGLSISYNIIKDFGGHLRAANAPEGGAIFTLELRRADLAQAA